MANLENPKWVPSALKGVRQWWIGKNWESIRWLNNNFWEEIFSIFLCSQCSLKGPTYRWRSLLPHTQIGIKDYSGQNLTQVQMYKILGYLFYFKAHPTRDQQIGLEALITFKNWLPYEGSNHGYKFAFLRGMFTMAAKVCDRTSNATRYRTNLLWWDLVVTCLYK